MSWLVQGATLTEVVQGAAAGVALQLVLGAPFLAYDAAAYLSRSFELSRVFFHVWSVNLKFLPEDVFQSKGLALALLAAHLALLWLFAQNRWCRREGGVGAVVQDFWQRSLRQVRLLSVLCFVLQAAALLQLPWKHVADETALCSNVSWSTDNTTWLQGKQRVAAQKLRPDHILLVLFSGNFIGILCARTLHFQFYSWYFHTLPFLLWQVSNTLPNPESKTLQIVARTSSLPNPCFARLRTQSYSSSYSHSTVAYSTRNESYFEVVVQVELHSIVRVGLWLVIELIWNMFPSTAVSSLSLMACHLGILLALRYQPVKQPSEKARGSPSVPHASSRTIRHGKFIHDS